MTFPVVYQDDAEDRHSANLPSDSRRALAPLLAAEVVSTTGTAMAGIALPWLVLTTTGSPSRAGLVATAELLPMAVLGIPSGAVADRLGPRKTIILCDGARAPLAAAVPLLYWAHTLPFGVLLGLAVAIGGFFPTHLASQRSILPGLVGYETQAISRGHALVEGASRVALLCGTAIAGGLVGLIGAPAVLLLDAATYLAAVVLVTLVPATSLGAATAHETDLLAGARYLVRDKLLRTVTFATAGFEFALQVIFLSLPILAFVAYDGNVGISAALLATWGTGALLGTRIAFQMATRDPLTVLRAGLIVQALPLWVLALDVSPLVLGGALLLAGLANPVANTPAHTLLTRRVPEPLEAKARLAFTTAALAAGVAGPFVAGKSAEMLGVHATLGCAAGVLTACGVGFASSTRHMSETDVRATSQHQSL